MSIPIIRLEIEAMEASILHAFSEYETQLDADLRASVETFCQPENIKRVIDAAVQSALNQAIREEVTKFFYYGQGRAIVAKVVLDRLTSEEPGEWPSNYNAAR